MKAVSLLLNSYLPPELRNYDQTFDVKSINKIMGAVAKKHPDKYEDIVKKVADLGRKASYIQGETISLADLEPVLDNKTILQSMADEIKALPRDKDFKQRRREIYSKYSNMIEKETSSAALKKRNNIAMAVLSGARGKTQQLKAMISPVGTFSDYKGEPIDVYSKESFAEGIRPATFLASTFGSRASVISTKSSTAKGGDLAKQFASTAADMVIRKDDCGTGAGISLPIDDESLIGRVLAKDVGTFKAGTFITRDLLGSIQKGGQKNVVVRSPITCSLSSGICAHCVGKLYKGGKLPRVGDSIGLLASTTTMEPVTQMALCLAPGTKVRMANGRCRAIEKIKIGDEVCGVDYEGELEAAPVTAVYKREFTQACKYTIQSDDDEDTLLDVVCSKDHKFMSWNYELEQFCKHPIIKCQHDNLPIAFWYDGEIKWGRVVKAGKPKTITCYDITISTASHLFLLKNGLVTSNSAKHTAGMSKDKKSFSGLEVIQQFTQSPEKFKDQGVVAEMDGTVDKIEDAPQGGTFVWVAGKKHYIPSGHEVDVKVGQSVEAGDQLADGLVDAEDIVRLKGLGEGRKYYAERLNQILADSGAKTDKRNTEILARAAIRHVRITNDDGVGDYLPDDVVDYSALQASFRPENTTTQKAKASVGKYLMAPVLHYTIGTRITPSVVKTLQDNGYEDIVIGDSDPGFTPEMVRLRTSSHSNPDWLASLGTSYLTQQLESAAVRGDDTNIQSNSDYRPRLMYGEGFGKNVDRTGEF